MGTKLSHKPKKMPRKHKIFVLEYLRDFNCTRAYQAAGFKFDSADPNSYLLLRNPAVKAAIKEEMDLRAKSISIDVSQMVRRLVEIAMTEPATAVTVRAGEHVMRYLGGFAADYEREPALSPDVDYRGMKREDLADIIGAHARTVKKANLNGR